jgi:hypothetical protein
VSVSNRKHTKVSLGDDTSWCDQIRFSINSTSVRIHSKAEYVFHP